MLIFFIFLFHLLTFLLGCINKCTLFLFHSLTLSFFSTLSFSLILPFDSFVYFTITLCLFVSLSFSCRLFSILFSSTFFFVSYSLFSFLFLLIFILILLFKNTFYFFIYYLLFFPTFAYNLSLFLVINKAGKKKQLNTTNNYPNIPNSYTSIISRTKTKTKKTTIQNKTIILMGNKNLQKKKRKTYYSIEKNANPHLSVTSLSISFIILSIVLVHTNPKSYSYISSSTFFLYHLPLLTSTSAYLVFDPLRSLSFYSDSLLI